MYSLYYLKYFQIFFFSRQLELKLFKIFLHIKSLKKVYYDYVCMCYIYNMVYNIPLSIYQYLITVTNRLKNTFKFPICCQQAEF